MVLAASKIHLLWLMNNWSCIECLLSGLKMKYLNTLSVKRSIDYYGL